MKPTQGRRTWIKVFVDDWLEGTTRYQMSDAQRAFWIDLLAMAGRSRFGGIVCSGKDGEQLIGYPLSKFQGLLAEPFDIEATFALFERTEKITMQVSGEGNRKLYVLFITNWARYQSEYDRVKKYRDASGATPNATDLLHAKSQPKRVWGHYIQKLGKNPKLLTFTAGRKQKGMARLRECLTKTGGDLVKAEGLMRCAVDALAVSAWHIGENDKKQKYDSWEANLFKSQEQLEKWLERT